MKFHRLFRVLSRFDVYKSLNNRRQTFLIHRDVHECFLTKKNWIVKFTNAIIHFHRVDSSVFIFSSFHDVFCNCHLFNDTRYESSISTSQLNIFFENTFIKFSCQRSWLWLRIFNFFDFKMWFDSRFIDVQNNLFNVNDVFRFTSMYASMNFEYDVKIISLSHCTNITIYNCTNWKIAFVWQFFDFIINMSWICHMFTLNITWLYLVFSTNFDEWKRTFLNCFFCVFNAHYFFHEIFFNIVESDFQYSDI